MRNILLSRCFCKRCEVFGCPVPFGILKMKSFIVIFTVVVAAMAADEPLPKQKRGLLGLDHAPFLPAPLITKDYAAPVIHAPYSYEAPLLHAPIYAKGYEAPFLHAPLITKSYEAAPIYSKPIISAPLYSKPILAHAPLITKSYISAPIYSKGISLAPAPLLAKSYGGSYALGHHDLGW
ncbi:uncharacterized protein LOC132704689 [Cylas formicarius]|uniref:uncharacterized protein LOC132704689 n=1 Tax=Cylas formicarius TaxID=197179 RepID=UPI002958384D|nr:uncharacterized protein LOC132704689 [Cylas formicarius]